MIRPAVRVPRPLTSCSGASSTRSNPTNEVRLHDVPRSDIAARHVQQAEKGLKGG